MMVLTGLLVWQHFPDVNEAHYLVKAKQFQDPAWCREDLFASSHQTHWLFYLTAGWPTTILGLEAVAWCGRLISWLITSWGLIRCFRALGWTDWQAIAFAPWVVISNLHLHLAGEWFVGGMEAKSFAWGFGLLAIASFLERRFRVMGLHAALTCGFHIVVGGWLCLALMLTQIDLICCTRGRLDSGNVRITVGTVLSRAMAALGKLLTPANAPVLLIATGLLLAGLLPALSMNQDAGRDEVREACEIQAFSRLAHHQDPMQFSAKRWIAFASMISVWQVLNHLRLSDRNGRRKQLDALAYASLAISVFGVIVAVLSSCFPGFRPIGATILVLYLFRLSDVIVPLAFVAHVAAWFEVMFPGHRISRVTIASLFGVLIFSALHGYENWHDPRSAAARQAAAVNGPQLLLKREIDLERNWIRLCRWIRSNSEPDDIFITPPNQQTFKWYAGRAEVANWKDMPQDAVRVLEWNRRWNELYGLPYLAETGVLGHLDSKILAIARRSGAGFLIVETRHVNYRKAIGYPPSFREVTLPDESANSTYTIYDLE
jgi:hypothetical protein